MNVNWISLLSKFQILSNNIYSLKIVIDLKLIKEIQLIWLEGNINNYIRVK